MTGKQMLKDVRTESELILAILQKREAKQKQNRSFSVENVQVCVMDSYLLATLAESCWLFYYPPDGHSKD